MLQSSMWCAENIYLQNSATTEIQRNKKY